MDWNESFVETKNSSSEIKWSNPQGINPFERPDFTNEHLSSDATFLGLSVVDSDVYLGTVWIALSTSRYKSYFIKLSSQPTGSLNIQLFIDYDDVIGFESDVRIV